MMDMPTAASFRGVPVPFEVIKTKPAISVVGLGYVGAVSTGCLSKLGHQVVGVDLDQSKIEAIGAGIAPIHEDRLSEFLTDGVNEGLVTTTDDLSFAVRETDVTFVSVGTPTAKDGGCDYRFIESAAKSIAVGLAQKSNFHTIVMRCSIPPGTTMNVMTPIIEKLSGKELNKDFGVVFNPEFLREGVAISDFFDPPKTVIGATCERSANVVSQIYMPVDENPIITTIEAAEMVKYVDNVWHATKVVFANEVGRLCKPFGVDSHEVMGVFVQDTKLNLSPYYLKPGNAYGGSCLPKEVRAVAHLAEEKNVDLPLVRSLAQSNEAQISDAVKLVKKTGAKRVGILGLAFKADTDDLRESPILDVIADLKAEGVELVLHDPAVTVDTPIEQQLAYTQHANPKVFGIAPDLREAMCSDLSEITGSVDAIIVNQNSKDYREFAEKSDCAVIDLVRINSELPTHANYQGIGW